MSGFSLRYLWAEVVFTVVLSVAPAFGSPIFDSDPIRCAACTPERLLECPAVAPDCQEALREPGCGCCLTCALRKGEPCGVYTAPCATGLRCSPRPDDPRPLHSLTNGQAVCTQSEPSDAPLGPDNTEANVDGSALHLLGLKPFEGRDASVAQESVKAKGNSIRKNILDQSPCHAELQLALERIAALQQKLGDKFTTFYLPNCDKHGFFKAKQCETSLEGESGRCWCVSSWNGKPLQGSTDLLLDSDCKQELTH
ncbi:hypothetical protein AGOR_G00033310 [Albula goreensis]|uniref:Insulin-like growth factor-binding protein 1 n=1 Tax=Albula goreensis TaxID=1534307 RepID=A0A8T3DVC4_9TELE|nr:hypothetical protein AGOR_G00033310 [Albula goreensis]